MLYEMAYLKIQSDKITAAIDDCHKMATKQKLRFSEVLNKLLC